MIVDIAKGFGGAETRVVTLAQRLTGAGQYHVAVLDRGLLQRRLQTLGALQSPIAHNRGDPRQILALRKIIQRTGVAVVDAQNAPSQFWAALACWHLPIGFVCTVHSVVRRSERGRIRPFLYEAILRLCKRRRAQFIAVSAEVRSYLVQIGVPPTQIELIYSGVSPPSIHRDHASLRAVLNLQAEDFVVAVPARLEPVKDHRSLFSALAILKHRMPRLRCLLLGTGREEPALRELGARLGLDAVLRFAGFRADVPEILPACDAICLPSLSEGLPYAALEAAAAARPLILSAVGGLAEAFVDGKTARLVAPADPEALAAALAWVAEHPAEARRLGEAARIAVRERFDPDVMVERTRAVYRRVATAARMVDGAA